MYKDIYIQTLTQKCSTCIILQSRYEGRRGLLHLAVVPQPDPGERTTVTHTHTHRERDRDREREREREREGERDLSPASKLVLNCTRS